MKLKLNNNPKISLEDSLPCIPLTYIESSGNQYIDTGYKANGNTTIQISIDSTTNVGNLALFGASNGGAYNNGEIATFWNNANIETVYPTGQNTSVVASINNIWYANSHYNILYNKTGLSINSSRVTFENFYNSYVGNRNIIIFGTNRTSTIALSSYKLYSFIIKEDSTTIHNFIPCKDLSGIVCMYDTITATFFYNRGSGNFIAGPELVYTPLEYIESSGTQYIDTGIQLNGNLEYEVKLGIQAQASGTKTYFGCWDVWNASGHYCPAPNTYTAYRMTNSFTAGSAASAGTDIGIANGQTGVLKLTNDTLSWSEGGSLMFNRTSFTISKNILLFCTYTGNTISEHSSFPLYYAKFYNGDTLIRDFIPCKDSNGVACLYDNVSRTFFYNSGTGTFIAGLEISVTAVSENFKQKCTDLFVKDCPNIDRIALLQTILNTSGNTLHRIRLNATNAILSLSQVIQLLDMNGFNDSMVEQTKPRIVGSITINDYISQELLTQLQNTLDGCTITAPNVIVWDDLAIQTLDSTKPNYNPAAAIVFNNNGKGTVNASPIVEGGGRYFMTKVQAATITDIGTWFTNISSISDSMMIVDAEEIKSYDLTSFDEFQYFTGVTSLTPGSGNGGNVNSGPLSMPLCTSIILPNSLTTLNGNAYGFSAMAPKATSLVSMDLKNIALNRDRGGDFLGCTSLREVTFGTNTQRIPSYEFTGCTNLTTLNNFSENGNIVVIQENAFRECSSLSNIEIPQTVTYIGTNAFFKCIGLNDFTIPSTVTSIGDTILSGAGNGTGVLRVLVSNDNEVHLYDNNGLRFKSVYINCSLYISHAGNTRSIERIYVSKNLRLGVSGITSQYPQRGFFFVEVLGLVTRNNTNCVMFPSNSYHDSNCIVHLGYEGIACEPTVISNNLTTTTWVHIYVGDGSSAEHDNAILQTYLADSAWSAYSSRIDTWYNYLQSQNS